MCFSGTFFELRGETVGLCLRWLALFVTWSQLWSDTLLPRQPVFMSTRAFGVPRRYFWEGKCHLRWIWLIKIDSLAELYLFAGNFVLIRELHCACVGMAKRINPWFCCRKCGSVGAAGCKPGRVISCSWGQNNFEAGNNQNFRILMNKMQF